MAYETTNPPQLLVAAIGDRPALWSYKDGDADSDVNASDYFTNGKALGMKVGDIVFVYDTATPKCSVHYVSAVDADGNATTAFAAVA
jgi:hypothetical protein